MRLHFTYPGRTLKLYRLVDRAHDPFAVGQFLLRPSNHSRQKNGDGMYFGLDVFEALRFRATRNHGYTDLLEVEVPNPLGDFFDLRTDQNAVVNSQFAGQLVAQRYLNFCNHHQKVGLIWSSMGANAWTEIVVLTPHVPNGGFEITNSAPV